MTVQRWLDHNSMQTSLIYIDWIPDHTRLLDPDP